MKNKTALFLITAAGWGAFEFCQGAFASVPSAVEEPSFEVEALDRQINILNEKIESLGDITKAKAKELHRLSHAAGGAHFVWEDGAQRIQNKRHFGKMIRASLFEDIKNIKELEVQKKSLEEEKIWILSTQNASTKNKVLTQELKKPRVFKCQAFPLDSSESPGLELSQDFGIKKDADSGLEWHSLGWWVGNVQGKVRACAGGKITFSGTIPGRGNVLIVEHGVNQMTVYANLDSFEGHKWPQKGQRIKTGEVLGFSRERFYFEVRLDGLAVNPRRVLSQDKVPFRT